MNRGVLISILLLSTVAIVIAAPVYAGVVITEIMYDLDGTDTGREWIEIQNTGSSQIDLTGWKFFEANTNHGITAANPQAFLLPAGAYAVIADNIEKFLVDWPSFSGVLFDSAFSLSNTSEAISIRNSELLDVDSVTYSSGLGANGDGNSLQRVNSEWAAALPTPGAGPINKTASEDQSAGTQNTNEPQTSSGGPVVMADSASKLKAHAGEDRTVLAGAEAAFAASAEGFTEDSVNKAGFFWNFGDGYAAAGKNIAHVFTYPGTYSVLLNVSFSGDSASDSAKITVVENPAVISEVKPGSFLEIYNNSARKIDFSGFGVGLDTLKPFYFPAGTFLSPYAYLALNSELLGFQIAQNGTLKLFYPNNKIVFSSVYPQLALGDSESLNFMDGNWFAAKATPGEKNTAPSKSKTIQAAGNSQAKAVENPKPNSETAVASVINIEHPGGGGFLKGIYFWLLLGLGAGILAGLGVILGKRYLA